VAVQPCVGPGIRFSFLVNFQHTLGLLGPVISPSQGHYLHRTTYNGDTKDKHPCPERDSNLRSSLRELKSHALDHATFGSVELKYDMQITNMHQVAVTRMAHIRLQVSRRFWRTGI
jgi:hypothetical protein